MWVKRPLHVRGLPNFPPLCRSEPLCNKRVVIQPKAVTLRFRQFFEIVAIGVDPLGRPRGIRIDIEIGKVAEQAERRAEDILNRSDELAAGEWGELAGRA